MSIRIILLAVMALVSAGGTAMLAKNWLASERAEIMASVPKAPLIRENYVEVLVAKKDLLVGAFITPDKLDWQEWPEDALGEKMLKKGDVTLKNFDGSVIRSRVPAGQPLLPSVMVKSGEKGYLAAVLAPGMRALTVPLSATSGVGGFVFPGDQVDLLLTISEKKSDKKVLRFTETLLKNVRVIGKDQSAVQVEGEARVAKSATLELTPKQAEMVQLATQMGKLSLSLRSLAEEDEMLADLVNDTPTTMSDLGHTIAYHSAKNSGLNKLEIEDEMSLTIDHQVNFYAQKMAKMRKKTGRSSTRTVQVSRGGQITTQKFR